VHELAIRRAGYPQSNPSRGMLFPSIRMPVVRR